MNPFDKNHCREHGRNDCSECHHRQMASQFFENQLKKEVPVSEYKLIEDLGLEVKWMIRGNTLIGGEKCVSADALNEVLKKGVRVWGLINEESGNHCYGTIRTDSDLNTALLINIQPIPKPLEKVSRAELIKFLESTIATDENILMLKRVKEAGICE